MAPQLHSGTPEHASSPDPSGHSGIPAAIAEIEAPAARGRARSWLLSGWRRPECGAAPLAVLSAAVGVLFNNSKLFSLLSERVDLASLPGVGCLLTVVVAMTGMVALAFLVLGVPYVFKPFVVATLVVSSILGYFAREFGTIFDGDMIRNIADTFGERNSREAGELITLRLFGHVLLLGLLPSAIVAGTRITWRPFRSEVRTRAIWAGGLALLFAVVTLPNLKFMIYVSSEHVVLKRYGVPTYAVESVRKLLIAAFRARNRSFEEVGTDAVRVNTGKGRTIGILVVGETARADHFSLNGYSRRTNPRLEARKLLNYTRAKSSGTSTAYSVPCMFSFLGKSRFSREKASRQSNVLDVLARAGVSVCWIENNSGCKGVADRIGYLDLQAGADPASPFYSDGAWFDEALVSIAESKIASTDGDILVVLHSMGSHGPAYYRRYPPEFEVFKPCCKDDSPQRSSLEEVANAYDNTIVYTDHVLDRLIALLERRWGSENTFLYYLSDHGESLGEDGVYLHGLPDLIAPAAQTSIPMFIWLSPGLVSGRGMDEGRLRERTGEPSSHDNLPATLLGLFQVQTSVYRRELDLLAR